MVSHKYRCIFVEVPKTGSTSIRAIIGRPPRPHLDIWQIKQEMGAVPPRKNVIERGIAKIPNWPRAARPGKSRALRQFDSYFKFGFVRNPWDRTVSLYNRKEGLTVKDRMSFAEFVTWIDYASATCIHPSPHRYQLDWFVDTNGEVLMDYIGRFEKLDEDWAAISAHLGIDEPLPHLKRNEAQKKHYSEYYTQNTRDIIARKFSVDIETFGYEFDG